MRIEYPRSLLHSYDSNGGSHRKGLIGRTVQEVEKINNCGAEGTLKTFDGNVEVTCGLLTDGQCLKKDWRTRLTSGKCALE